MQERKRNWMPVLFMGLGVVLLAAALMVGLGSQGASSPSDSAALPTPTVFEAVNPHGADIAAATEPQSPDEVKRVKLADAYSSYQAGIAVFVDVRGADAYQLGHIPGALSIPEAELPQRLSEIDPGMMVLTYCT